jgi:PTH1 family peptidyl-tRNA hydrolase
MLVQSPTFMNNSGTFVAPAWKDMVSQAPDPSCLGLVIVHDDLEVRMGQTKERKWATSARGHNGVRDIHGRLERKPYQNSGPWTRFSVGIGRPEAKENLPVRSYVLQPIGKELRQLLLQVGPPGLLSHLQSLEEKWLEENSDGASKG